jgi:hypothetical protein
MAFLAFVASPTAATATLAHAPAASILGALLGLFRPRRLDFDLELSQAEVDADLRHGRDDG